jgi:hypothetical protein
MDQSKKWLPLFGVIGVLSVVALSAKWSSWPKSTLEGFVADTSQGRIVDAARQLAAPCELVLLADGGLRVVDASGRETLLAAGHRFVASSAAAAPKRGFQDTLAARQLGEVSVVYDQPEARRFVLQLTCVRDEVRIDALTLP